MERRREKLDVTHIIVISNMIEKSTFTLGEVKYIDAKLSYI